MTIRRMMMMMMMMMLMMIILMLKIGTAFVLATYPRPLLSTFSSSASLLPRDANIKGRASASLRSARTPSPFNEQRQYRDGLGAKIWIFLFSRKIAEVIQVKPPTSFITYEDYVELSKILLTGGPNVAKESVLSVLRTIAFPGFSNIFRILFPGSARWACELNANITPIFFSWLVGPAEVEAAEIYNVKNGKVEIWNSAVKIERCRYLESTACKGACSGICKIPTQTFFTEDLNMPCTMKPNFDDLSCLMTFGQAPLPLSEDPIFAERCYKECSTAQMSKKVCPRVTALLQASSSPSSSSSTTR